ncbi:uncharacterized protein TNCT_68141 [Trichonephila clavata]|uniref:Uncharacterized protein n=1 Tax=Trichonephila clavata TaxID=2740835 RepID=A0A8X6GEU9_TRICU|nr:uncharacterized protein TNCT_68141 [Trichonephila clavata]
MYEFELLVPAEEAIFIERPQITFSIHSPYLLDNNTIFKDKLNLGSSYDINIRLEEQHFLPSPFLTDCMDYHDLWEANGRNGPRSQISGIWIVERSRVLKSLILNLSLWVFPAFRKPCGLLKDLEQWKGGGAIGIQCGSS